MRKVLFLATLFSLMLSSAWAQEKKPVGGTVKDATGNPLPGVTIMEKGTTNGTISTGAGTFSFQVAPNATLVIKFMGFTTQEIAAAGTNMQIVLKEDATALGEVVVTALGIKRESRKLGYAMTELKGADLANTNSINPVAALQGKVAGLDISGAAGGPQAANRIVLRGAKSLDGKDQPIFIIDGVIFENETADDAVNFGNILKNFNQDDFETVSVLKGAAATALYGSRAINGAVLITTKKGTIRKGLGVDFSQTFQMEKVYRSPIAMQNKYGAGTDGVFNEDGQGNKVISWSGNSFGPKMEGQLAKLPNGDIVPFSAMPDNVIDGYQTGKYSNTNVAVEGGNEKANFRASFSRLANNSVEPNNQFNRNTFSLRSSAVISEWLTAESGVSYSESKTMNPTRQGGDYTNHNIGRKWIYIFPRNYDPAYWSARYLGAEGATTLQKDVLNDINPTHPGADYWFVLNHDSWARKERLIMGNLSLTATVTDWLKLVGRGNFSNEQISDDRRELGWGPNFGGSRGMYALSGQNKNQYTFTGMAMINPKLGNPDLELNVVLGGETWSSGLGNQYYAATSGGLRIPGQFALTNSVNVVNANNNRHLPRKRINSVFGSASLAYKNALFLDVTTRNDWSSSLIYPTGNGTYSYMYPSVTAAWDITESFKGQLPSSISFAKVRASYAVVGSDTDPYQLNQGYNMTELWNNGSGSSMPLYAVYDRDVLPNMNLKPSMSHSFEVGADVRFFDNRLGFDVAAYKTNIKDQILGLDVASESGVRRKLINAGNFLNKGIEIAIDGTPIKTANFSWNVNLNGSRNVNKILELYDGVETYEMGNDQNVEVIAKVGETYGVIKTNYGFTRYQSNDPALNGKPIIASNGTQYQRGYAEVGNITPDFIAGLTNNFRYKNWTLGVMLQGRFGGDIFSASHHYGTGRGVIESTLPGRDAESGGIAWTDGNNRQRNDGMIPDGVFAPGTIKGGQDVSGMTYQAAYEAGLVTPLTPYQYYAMMGDWGIGIRETSIFDASYIAIREVSVGYNFPTHLANRLKLNKARVMLVGRNLGYLYNNLPDNINPESLRNNRTSAFSEYGGAPFVRNMALTIQLGF
jgi:iron complex outermembrane receptor protein